MMSFRNPVLLPIPSDAMISIPPYNEPPTDCANPFCRYGFPQGEKPYHGNRFVACITDKDGKKHWLCTLECKDAFLTAAAIVAATKAAAESSAPAE